MINKPCLVLRNIAESFSERPETTLLPVVGISPGMPVKNNTAAVVIKRYDYPLMSGHDTLNCSIMTIEPADDKM